MKQLVTPNPDIPCEPGWCLQYVRQTFGAPIVEPTATKGWENAKYKHFGRDFPDAWVPVWYGIDTEPAGHVVLRAPDGRVYSTSTYATKPYIHPSLDHLEWFYGYYGMTLQYRGWTEDISNVRVVFPTEESEEMLTVEQDRKLTMIFDRTFGRDVQRYFNPNTLEVRNEPFPGAIPARSTDVHDVISTNNLLTGFATRMLAAVAAIPGVTPEQLQKLSDDFNRELNEVLSGIKLTLEVPDRESV